MEKSTHRVEIVRIHPEPHPNADRLEIVKVYGYTCAVQKGQFKDGELAAYIPPDSVVPDSQEYAFLGGHRRIRVKKLRGIISMGLLMPAPDGASEGDDVAAMMGIEHYDPPEPMTTGGENEKAPSGYHPVYDVDTLRRYAHVFREGEPVWVTEKLHGANGRWCFADGRIYAGSHRNWKKQDAKSIWWRVVEQYPELPKFCEANPNVTVYGEVYGAVQSLKYGTKPGELRLAVFDLLVDNEWADPQYAEELGRHLPLVPFLGIHPFSESAMYEMAEGPSLIPGAEHIREGIVIKPLNERTHSEIGRVQLKVVASGYLERAV